ncbi:MAG: hypothetical protein IPK63_19770 [Candidatus Competibacteraceae bacterium]|nr:hypothetical protein [Candidatus Competibacteraceae bacterium]
MPGPVNTHVKTDPLDDLALRRHGLLGRGINHHAMVAVSYDQLPFEAQQTLAHIIRGGPFSHPNHDGGEFGNRFGDLPRGEYLEFTVPTPGAPNRAMRRLVVRRKTGQVFFTACHYERVGATGGNAAQRQAAIQVHAQTLDPLWRNGFYIVTGLTVEQRNSIVAAVGLFPY